jgi:hypothetical protein
LRVGGTIVRGPGDGGSPRPVSAKPPGQGPDGEGGEQPPVRDGQRDHVGLGGWRLIGPDRGQCAGVGFRAERASGLRPERLRRVLPLKPYFPGPILSE